MIDFIDISFAFWFDRDHHCTSGIFAFAYEQSIGVSAGDFLYFT